MDLVEVERKRELSDEDTTAVMSRLSGLGWAEVGTSTEVDTYYTRPDVDYMQTVECLRVREGSGYSEITYKPPSDKSTHSDDNIISKIETNVALVGDGGPANQLLKCLGMVLLARVEKKRTTYRVPDRPHTVVALDEIKGLGMFLEVEVMHTDPVQASEILGETESRLGVSSLPVVSRPYRDLVMLASQAS